ncbi:MAG: histidinol dehydrogenase [Bacteroidales bacterium]
MEIIKNLNKNDWKETFQRPSIEFEAISEAVDEIFREVEKKGDKALFRYTNFFDKAKLDKLKVSDEELDLCDSEISEDLKDAIKIACNNIQKFHNTQSIVDVKVKIEDGINCWQKHVPIENVGLYIPGGSAPLFSSVLMLAIPAKLAGCKNINLCSPPNSAGKIHPAILYAAKEAGVKNIYKIGGIQAIAAMAIGTESISKVDKIYGPGNQYVTAAKLKALQYNTAIDMPAGPSEVLIIADQSAKPGYLAADLLSQAEHGPDSQVILISWDEMIIKETIEELKGQIELIPRSNIAKKSLEHAKIILCKDDNEAISLSNFYAPEHLIIATENTSILADRVINAGSVFLGNYSPESAGDYASGTNHTLPTSGFAKSFSGLNIFSFMKKISFQEISKSGLNNLAKTITCMAEEEGLIAHKNAVKIRLKD